MLPVSKLKVSSLKTAGGDAKPGLLSRRDVIISIFFSLVLLEYSHKYSCSETGVLEEAGERFSAGPRVQAALRGD